MGLGWECLVIVHGYSWDGFILYFHFPGCWLPAWQTCLPNSLIRTQAAGFIQREKPRESAATTSQGNHQFSVCSVGIYT